MGDSSTVVSTFFYIPASTGGRAKKKCTEPFIRFHPSIHSNLLSLNHVSVTTSMVSADHVREHKRKRKSRTNTILVRPIPYKDAKNHFFGFPAGFVPIFVWPKDILRTLLFTFPIFRIARTPLMDNGKKKKQEDMRERIETEQKERANAKPICLGRPRVGLRSDVEHQL